MGRIPVATIKHTRNTDLGPRGPKSVLHHFENIQAIFQVFCISMSVHIYAQLQYYCVYLFVHYNGICNHVYIIITLFGVYL